jgi:hypothetical protein
MNAAPSICIAALLFSAASSRAAEPEPARIVIECEDMRGVAQDRFGPGKSWQVGRWGHDLYQNMVFGGVWASRLRNAMTDETDEPAEVTAEIEVLADGAYKVWAKYECPPFFNYAFGIRIEPAGGGAAVFERTYGLRDAAKHFCFTSKLTTGDLYWNWGIDHDAAEGYEAKLAKGRYRVTLAKTTNVEPKGARSVDAILITSDLAALSAPKFPRYPLLDELRRANHVYFRFRNPKSAATPIKIVWNHWGHRPNDYYIAQYRELVKFYDAAGQPIEGGKNGDWLTPIAPGEASPWHDLGPTMNTESTSPYSFRALAPDVKPGTARKPAGSCEPFAVDIATAPAEAKIVKSFDLGAGDDALTLLVQPDLDRPEGVASTLTLSEVYRTVALELDGTPRLGPLPKKLRLFAGTGTIGAGDSDLPVEMAFREAIGLNTLPANTNPKVVPRMLELAKARGSIIERSLSYHHTQDPAVIVKWVREGGVEKQIHFVSYGDEIGLPAVDVKNPAKVEAFREYLKKRGESPALLGVASWDDVKPLSAMSADVAIQIGVLPREQKDDATSLAKLKRLYWHSTQFRTAQGIAAFAEKTAAIRSELGSDVHTTANLGGMHPFYWMHQSSFIESFKHGAMSLAWTEDYTYCQPEGSRLVVDFEAGYLRKGASYHDQPMMYYCMPHWPGNTPEYLLQCAVMEWGQNVKDLDFFWASPDAFSTENYVTFRGGMPIWKALRTISGMAGLIEEHLLPARTEPARIAMLLSEASDVWELNGRSQGSVVPGSEETNISQEERKALWYALRSAGHRVDFVTEADCAEGLLKNYTALYVCGRNLERRAAGAIRSWVESGGTLFATAGAARKDEFDEPLTELDAVFGRGAATADTRYRGALRARLELLFEKPLDQIKFDDGRTMNALCSREEFSPTPSANVLGNFASGKPAWIANAFGKGRAFYAGTLPGQAWLKPAMPFTPMGKGGTQSSPWMIEPLDFDATAAAMILEPLKHARILPDTQANVRGVAINRLKSPKSTLLTVVNLAQQKDGDLKNVELRIDNLPSARRAWSCFHSTGSLPMRRDGDTLIVTLPSLAATDIVVVE